MLESGRAMFDIPPPTDYDLKFRLLGIPVRVHPFFWAMTAVLGWSRNDPVDILIWIACVFVSILVHEFGHGLTARTLFPTRPAVFLYLLGGLCSYEGDSRHPWRRALVLAMGPCAGFLLFGLVLGLGLTVLGVGEIWPFGVIVLHRPPSWFTHLPERLNISIQVAYNDLLFINWFWGLVNFLPIYPLDGGQLANLFLTMHDRREGPMRGFAVGMFTAAALAIYLASERQYFNAFFIANLAFMNFQLFQAAQAHRNSVYSFEDDDSWWRK
jgi:Zn-dependent protease